MARLNEQEAREYLGGQGTPVAPGTLPAWRSRGQGPNFIRIGRLVRYETTDLDDFITAGRVTPTKTKAAPEQKRRRGRPRGKGTKK